VSESCSQCASQLNRLIDYKVGLRAGVCWFYISSLRHTYAFGGPIPPRVVGAPAKTSQERGYMTLEKYQEEALIHWIVHVIIAICSQEANGK
jgi:hypothetical protein